jgi:hypothetical protein
MYTTIILLLVNAVYLCTAARLSIPFLGGDRDANGCITSAGYTWCDVTETCVSVNQLCIPPTLGYIADGLRRL